MRRTDIAKPMASTQRERDSPGVQHRSRIPVRNYRCNKCKFEQAHQRFRQSIEATPRHRPRWAVQDWSRRPMQGIVHKPHSWFSARKIHASRMQSTRGSSARIILVTVSSISPGGGTYCLLVVQSLLATAPGDPRYAIILQKSIAQSDADHPSFVAG